MSHHHHHRLLLIFITASILSIIVKFPIAYSHHIHAKYEAERVHISHSCVHFCCSSRSVFIMIYVLTESFSKFINEQSPLSLLLISRDVNEEQSQGFNVISTQNYATLCIVKYMKIASHNNDEAEKKLFFENESITILDIYSQIIFHGLIIKCAIFVHRSVPKQFYARGFNVQLIEIRFKNEFIIIQFSKIH